jgi:diketogulonate reductase-like aldo/keto reductase
LQSSGLASTAFCLQSPSYLSRKKLAWTRCGRRLGTDHLDLYLLHFPVPNAELSGVVAGFESLRAAGKIRAWGVSNFTLRQLEDLFHVPQGDRCATNQILYNLDYRGVENDLLPWCEPYGMPVMAYSPLGGLGAGLLRDPTLARIGAAHDCSAVLSR